MSVLEIDKVDGIGIDKDEESLVLLITDHLDWKNEYEHLIKLQDKINTYIGFLESNQYEDLYPEKQFSTFIIEIHFMFQPIDDCLKFIDTVNKQLSTNNIKIEVVTNG